MPRLQFLQEEGIGTHMWRSSGTFARLWWRVAVERLIAAQALSRSRALRG